MNYYPFHIGDFRSGTVNMSRKSRWIYRDMLDVYYDTETPLSLDLDVLCDAIGVEADDERKIVERLLKFKFEKSDTGYRHAICEEVISNYRQKAETAKANGRRGGRPKNSTKEPHEKPSGFQHGSEMVGDWIAKETNSEANQEPRTKNQEPSTTLKGGGGKRPSRKCPDDFVVTDSMVEWAKSEAALVNMETATSCFRDHTFKNSIVDWPGAWRNWLRKDQTYAAQRISPRSKPAMGGHTGFSTKDYREGVSEDGSFV